MPNIDSRALAKMVSETEEFKNLALEEARKQLREEKATLIENFNSHPVTQEINAGPTAKNTSGALRGKGNLFSFIGFEAGTDPIKPLEELIKRETRLTGTERVRVKSGEIIVEFDIKIPSQEEISRAAPLPFEAGRGWAAGIEKGISGFGNYLRKAWSSSRSGAGIQVDHQVRNGVFKPRGYLSDIFLNFINKFK